MCFFVYVSLSAMHTAHGNYKENSLTPVMLPLEHVAHVFALYIPKRSKGNAEVGLSRMIAIYLSACKMHPKKMCIRCYEQQQLSLFCYVLKEVIHLLLSANHCM